MGTRFFRDHAQLMFRHGVMCFVFDSGNLRAFFRRAHHAPKIHQRAGFAQPSLLRRDQRIFSQQNIADGSSHAW